jgi:hypothetical protein
MNNDHMVLSSFNETDYEVVDCGSKEKMRDTFDECLANGEGNTYYLVKILLQATPSYEIEANDDADEQAVC